jgi:autotransporter-associated beta strand protein
MILGSKKLVRVGLIAATTLALSASNVMAQTSFTSTSATGAWNTARWNNSTDGPAYSSTYTANQPVNFTSTTGTSFSFAGMGAAINVGNVTVAPGVSVTFGSTGSTYSTNAAVRTMDIGSGASFNFNGQAISTSTGTGFNKTGSGTLIMGAGGTFAGGFTLGSGTVVAGGVNALGAAGALALNGGTLTVSSGTNRDFTGKYSGGITVGGDVQFGDSVGVAAGTGGMTFSNTMALGNLNRTLTLGYGGTVVFGGVISNTGTPGVTFAATAGGSGRFDVTNAANTFTGDININGGEVRFTTDGSMGNAANDIIVDGGRFAKASDSTTVTLAAGRDVFVGDGVGTSISSPGSGVLVINNAIQNKTGETGSWAKQGSGTLQLGGVSTYTGSTAINSGTLQLTTGNNRLPTGTSLSLGQAASTNVGTLDLNGFNQQVAGLSSTAGLAVGPATNVITSVSAATLNVNGGGVYSDGTAANSGVISGAVSLVKSGSGVLTLGGNNSYTGTTSITGGTLDISSTGQLSATTGVTINGGELKYNGSTALTAPVTFTAGTISGTGTIASALTVGAGATLSPGNSPGILSFDANQTWAADGNYNWQILDATGVAGPDFDQVQITGALTVESGFNLNLWSLSSISPDVNGNALNFDNTVNQSWIIANATGGIVDAFNLATANIFVGANNGTGGFSNSLGGGSFSVAAVGNDVVLSFTAVPEPSTLALLGAGVLGLAVYAKRRRSVTK